MDNLKKLIASSLLIGINFAYGDNLKLGQSTVQHSQSTPTFQASKLYRDHQAKINFFNGNDFSSDDDSRGAAQLRNGAVFAVLLNDPTFTYGIDASEISSRRLSNGEELFTECPSISDPDSRIYLETFHKKIGSENIHKNFKKYTNPFYVYHRGSSFQNQSQGIQFLEQCDEISVNMIIHTMMDLMEQAFQQNNLHKQFETQCMKIVNGDYSNGHALGTFIAGEHITKSPESVQDKILRTLTDSIDLESNIKSKKDTLKFIYGFDDLLRGTIVVSNYKDVAKVMELILQKVNPNTKFGIKYLSDDYVGYVGVHAYIPFHAGDITVIAELQIHTAFEMEAQKRTHKAYEVARNAQPKSKEQNIGYFADAIVFLDAMISGMGLDRDQATTFARQVRKDVQRQLQNWQSR